MIWKFCFVLVQSYLDGFGQRTQANFSTFHVEVKSSKPYSPESAEPACLECQKTISSIPVQCIPKWSQKVRGLAPTVGWIWCWREIDWTASVCEPRSLLSHTRAGSWRNGRARKYPYWDVTSRRRALEMCSVWRVLYSRAGTRCPHSWCVFGILSPWWMLNR